MEIGFEVVDFNWKGGPSALGPALADFATSVEQAGVTRLAVMDHFWQINGLVRRVPTCSSPAPPWRPGPPGFCLTSGQLQPRNSPTL